MSGQEIMDSGGLRKTALRLAARLREGGHVVYYAGGCVRDRLRGVVAKDIDMATSARPDEVLKLFPRGDAIGAHFGVILVRESGIPFEIATFREDGLYGDGRHPDFVNFSSPERDALRRDFTVNGLFEDPWTGEVIDYVGGVQDLEAKIIRAIGEPEKRFEEDALRLMRAVRFAVTTGFDLEAATWEAVCRCSGWLEKISVERVREEFLKILDSPRRARGLDLLMESGLMRFIIPELYRTVGCEQPPQWHPEGDVYTHTCLMLDMLEGAPSRELILAVLLHDIGKPPTFQIEEETGRIRFSNHDSVGAEMTGEILRRLKFSNLTVERTTEMVANHMNFMNVQNMRTARLRRFMGRPAFTEEMELHRVDCASSNGFTDNYEFLEKKLEEFSQEPILPPRLVTGRDLIGLGLAPGPLFREYLDSVQTEQLERRVNTREEALACLKKMISSGPGTDGGGLS